MKLYTKIIYTLCICLSFMSCQSNDEQGDKFMELTLPVMPRKLKINGEAMVKDYGKTAAAFESMFNKQDVASSGNIETKEANANKVKQEELDEAKEAEYFTMDYKSFRKRRPIHNKSEPSAAASP